MTDQNLDTIFQILGNNSRRKIIDLLSEEPMYFNQISKEVGIGQQAMLRHMHSLDKTGFVKSFGEKSNYGAPDRKYYQLDTSFTLSISVSKDNFSMTHNDMHISANAENPKIKDKINKMQGSTEKTVDYLYDNLQKIDEEILLLEEKIHCLREVRQILLQKTHDIGKDQFNDMDRKVFYSLMMDNPQSIHFVSNKIGKKNSQVKSSLNDISSTLRKGKVKKQAEELVA